MFRASLELSRHALNVLPDVPGHHRTRLLGLVGFFLNLLEEPGSLESIERGISEAEELGDKRAVMRVKYWLIGLNYSRGRMAEACRVGDEVLGLLEDTPDPEARLEVLQARVIYLPFLGRLDEAIPTIQEARRLSRERGDVGTELMASFGELLATGMSTGDGRRIDVLGHEMAEGFDEAGRWGFYGLLLAAQGRFWQGPRKKLWLSPIGSAMD